MANDSDGIVSIEGSSRDKKKHCIKRVAYAERIDGART